MQTVYELAKKLLIQKFKVIVYTLQLTKIYILLHVILYCKISNLYHHQPYPLVLHKHTAFHIMVDKAGADAVQLQPQSGV